MPCEPSLDSGMETPGWSLGNLFINSLLTKAKIYTESFPNQQIIIIGRSSDKEIIRSKGFKILHSNNNLLKSDYIKNAILSIKTIRSVDIYAHSNALSGVSLDSNSWITHLFNEKDDFWDVLKNKLTSESFIFIHGCNAGVKMAPELAIKLKIAVLAALTSTDFQYIYDDLIWAFDYNAKGLDKSKINKISFEQDQSCGSFCTRMKPDNFTYRGYWGDWSAGGYPTFKLFCGDNDNKNCEKGAVEAVATFPSVINYAAAKLSQANFKTKLIDFMCPFAHNPEAQSQCELELVKYETSVRNGEVTNKTYSPFKGKTLDCDMIKCKAYFQCSKKDAALNPSKCKLINESTEASSSFTNDYLYIINAFKNSEEIIHN